MDPKPLLYWIKERESIRLKRQAGEPKPWTDDAILQEYKFCNIDRENDRVTKWIKDNWRDPFINDENMWYAMAVARLFNWPDTLFVIGYPMFVDDDWFKEIEEELISYRSKKNKVWTGAYLVSTNGVKMDKISYVLQRVLKPLWKDGRAPKPGETLSSYQMHLTSFDGFGSFMGAQVIADLKHTPMLADAPDWWTWAALGPGSTRGLNRLYGRPLDAPLNQAKGLGEIQQLKAIVQAELGMNLCCQNIQNCLCETDKYLRVLNSEGKPRSLYPGR